MSAPSNHIAICWLCRKLRPLTLDHIPPRSAFNRSYVRIQQVSEHHRKHGRLGWVPGRHYSDGYSVRSLCLDCNQAAGRSFAPPYQALARQVAEQVSTTPLLGTLTIHKVQRPQLVLRQVIFQFVSANGPTFVEANPWVQSFLRRNGSKRLPDDVCVYLFAINSRSMKTTGVSGHIIAGSDQIRIVSEFTFGPIGTVLSWGELPNAGLTAIHDWCDFDFASKRTAEVSLRVNPLHSALPVDFRLRSQILAGQFIRPVEPIDVTLLPELDRLLALRSGRDKDSFMLTAHPSQARALERQRQ